MQTKHSKPGPQETLHTLAPLTFDQALNRLLKAKPPQPTKPKTKRTRSK